MSPLRWLRLLARALTRKTARASRRSAPRLEILEDRTVLSWSGSLAGTVLNFTASANSDSLILGVNNQGLIVQNIVGGGYAGPTDLDPSTPGVQSLSLSALTQLNVLR